MRGRLARLLVLGLLAAGASACADNSAAEGTGGLGHALEVRNLTQWAVWEVRLHPAPVYADVRNRLGAPPIAPRGAQRFDLGPSDATAYITVIRDKVQDGDKIAFTSAFPVDLRGYNFALEVLENEFRLRPLGQLPDAGAPGPRRDAGFDARILTWDARRRDGGRDAARRDASHDAADGGQRDAPAPGGR